MKSDKEKLAIALESADKAAKVAKGILNDHSLSHQDAVVAFATYREICNATLACTVIAKDNTPDVLRTLAKCYAATMEELACTIEKAFPEKFSGGTFYIFDHNNAIVAGPYASVGEAEPHRKQGDRIARVDKTSSPIASGTSYHA